jgi:predicted ATPase
MTVPLGASELSRFFGRQEELRTLAELFEEQRRVAVLVGPSGAGKTRLARELVRRSGDVGAFADLSRARDPEQLVAQIAAALERPLNETRELGAALEQLGLSLAARRRSFLVLDRAEQLGDDLVPLLESLTNAAPEARFVVTSRVRLGIPGAAEVAIEGLPVDSEAVLLFVDRATLQRPGWQPEPGELAEIEQLVRLLGGLPLAIELAAARSNVVGARELITQLARGRASPGAGAGQISRALNEAIDGAFGLLSDAERRAAEACSVFAGSFSFDAAEAVLCELASELAVVDLLHALANQSILRRGAAGSIRLGMLEPVRAHAEQRLAADPALERRIRDRHADYFVELGARARIEYMQQGDRASLDQLALEQENLSAALEWLSARADEDGAAAARSAALALALHTLFWARGPIGLHLQMLERALGAASGAGVEAEVDLLLAHSTALAHGIGKDAALAAAERALELARAGQHEQRAGRALSRIARVHAGYGEPQRAAELATQALEAARHAGDSLGEAYACSTRAAALHRLGQLEAARSEIVQALGLLRTIRRPRLELESLELLAAIERALGRTERASAVLEDALEACRRLGDERVVAKISCELAALHERSGEPERALDHYERADAALGRLGSLHEQLGARLHAAALRLELGDPARARSECEQALELARRLGDRAAEAIGAALIGVADCAADRLGHAERQFELAELCARSAGPEISDAVALHRGHHEIALARRAEQQGAAQDAARAREAAQARLAAASGEPAALWSDRARQAARMLERALASGARTTLAVADDGSSFRAAGAPPVALGNRRLLCRLLALLADQHALRPGQPLGYDEISLALWPGERMLASAARSRIHVAISTLRKLGLGDLIRVASGGYYLDPAIELTRAAGKSSD